MLQRQQRYVYWYQRGEKKEVNREPVNEPMISKLPKKVADTSIAKAKKRDARIISYMYQIKGFPLLGCHKNNVIKFSLR